MYSKIQQQQNNNAILFNKHDYRRQNRHLIKNFLLSIDKNLELYINILNLYQWLYT